MPPDEQGGFTVTDAQRIARATKAVERAYQLPPLPGGSFMSVGAGAVPAVTTSAITAKSGSTVGTGTVELYDMDESGSLSSNGVTLPVWNMGGAVATGKDVVVVFGLRGPWLVVEPC